VIYGYFRVNNEYKEGKFMAFNKLLKVGAIAAAVMGLLVVLSVSW